MSNRKIRDISIKNLIFIVFLLLTLSTDGLVGYVVFSRWLSSADSTSTRLAADLNADIYQKIDSFMEVPLLINEANQQLIKSNVVDLNNEAERDKFFAGVLKSQGNDIYSFSLGTENGQYYGARRNQNNIIELMKNDAATGGQSLYYSVNDDMTRGQLSVNAGKFDPRTRDWYKAAKAAGKPVFSPVYKHFVMNDLTISAAFPIYDQTGNLKGVLGTHLILSDINKFLKDVVSNNNGYAVIFEKNTGALISNSFGMDNFTSKNGTLQRYTLKDSGNQALRTGYEQYISNNQSSFKYSDTGNGLYFNFKEYSKNGLTWVVMTAVPEELLMSDILKNMLVTMVLLIMFIAISITIYLMLTKKLFKPVDSLIDATEKLSMGDLSQRAPIIREDEVGRLSRSFNSMAETMYNLVHNLELTVQSRTVELKTANTALEESKDQLRLILDSTAEAIYGMDKDGNCTFCNASCVQMLGYKSQEELIGKNMHMQIHHSYSDGTPMPVNECKIYSAFLNNKGTHGEDEVFWRADGSPIEVEYYSYPQYKNGEVIGAVVTFMDNSERKRNSDKIKYLSSHDALTGLYNRRSFEEALSEMNDKPESLPLSVIFGDVNGLKMINDIFGHASGDALIKNTADVLKRFCRNDDIVSRVGGDEFIILMPNTTLSDAEKIADRVKTELSRQKVYSIKSSLSMGCDTKTAADQDMERIIQNAENKMYKEKTLNRSAANKEMLDALMAVLHEKAPREKLNSVMVSDLCIKLGQILGLPETTLKKCKDAGYLYNIGKAVLSEKILSSTEPYTEEEQKELEQYPVTGYRILSLFHETLNIAGGVYSHKENWDGTGYPRGLRGEEIPGIGRIIAVADAYNNFKTMFNEDIALAKTKELVGTRLDPLIVEALEKLVQDKVG